MWPRGKQREQRLRPCRLAGMNAKTGSRSCRDRLQNLPQPAQCLLQSRFPLEFQVQNPHTPGPSARDDELRRRKRHWADCEDSEHRICF